ncbi:MAG: PrsW family glutamic-type intramembrane protease [Anaerolineales bacterium]
MNASNRKRDQLSVLLLIASILAFLLAAAGFIVLALLGTITGLVDKSAAAGPTLIIAAAFLVMGVCTIPGIYFGYQGMQGRFPEREDKPLRRWIYICFLFPVALGVGYLAFNRGVLPALLGPLAHISAAIIPVVFALAILFRKGSPISAKRIWGHFLAGLWASPMVAFIAEILAALPLILIVFATLFQETNSQGLIENLTSPEQWNETYLVTQTQDLTNQPLILCLILAFLLVFVPLVEEAIKTIGIWPVIRRGFTQYQAFIGGAIAGAGYGLFEAFFLGQPGVSWVPVMIARAGATMMHMITTALTSLGIARARESGRWSHALRYYFGAVLLHSLWNISALGVGVIVLFLEDLSPSTMQPGLPLLSSVAGIVLLALSLTAFLGLWLIPGKLFSSGEDKIAQTADD